MLVLDGSEGMLRKTELSIASMGGCPLFLSVWLASSLFLSLLAIHKVWNLVGGSQRREMQRNVPRT